VPADAYQWNIPLVAGLSVWAEWDWNDLYLHFSGSNPNVTQVKIAGKTVTNISQDMTISWGDVFAGGLTAQNFPGSVTLDITASGAVWNGTLVLDINKIVKSMATDYVFTPGSSESKTHDMNNNKDKNAMSANAENDTVVNAEVDFKTLTNGRALDTNTRRICVGMTFNVLDDLCLESENDSYRTQGFLFGFYKQDGVVYLIHRYTEGAVEGGTVKTESVPVDCSEGEKSWIRVEYDYDADSNSELDYNTPVSATYYVNGKLVARAENVRVKLSGTNTFGTRVPGILTRVYTTDQELTITHLSVAHKDNSIIAGEQPEVSNNNYFHAVFTSTSVAVDGKLDERAYRRILPLTGSLYASAAWDQENLYLAFAGNSVPNVTQLKINDYNVDMSTGKLGTGTREVAVPLSSVGISDYAGAYTITMQVDGVTWSGSLVLDNVDFETVLYNSLNYGASDLNNKEGFKLDTWAVNEKGQHNYMSIAVVDSEKLTSVAGTSTVVEFDMAVENMPDGYTTESSPTRAFLNNGIVVSVRDGKDTTGKNGFIFGLGKKGGQMYLICWYTDAANKAKKAEIPVGNVDNCYVRVEYAYGEGNAVTAKYYINGILIHEQESSYITGGSFGTSVTNRIQFIAYVPTASASATHKVVASVNHVSVGHTNPNLAEELTVTIKQVEQMIANIGTVSMDRADYIRDVLAGYNNLGALAQTLVKNADVLQKAVEELKKLESSFLHAVFVPTPVVVDGKADETAFRRNLTLGATKFGAAWDAKNLYLYFAGASTPNVTELKINGKTVNTTGVTGSGVREIQVKLKDLGITSLADTYPVSLKIGNLVWSGILVLDNVDFETVLYNSLNYGASDLNNKEGFKLDTWAVNEEGQHNYMSIAVVDSEKLTSVAGTSTVVEFDMAVENMPDGYTAGSSPTRTFLNNGIVVSVRDDKDATGKNGFIFGLGKKGGQMYLICWYTDAANKAKKAEIPVGNVDNCYVRVEYAYGEGNAVTATYYVNGILIHEQESSYITGGSFGTSVTNRIQFIAYVPTASASATHKVVASVDHVSVGHAQSTLANDLSVEVPKVEALVDAIGLPVTLESKPKIDAALNAYNNLSNLAKTQVSNLAVLETAQARLQMLQNSYLHAAFSSEDPVLDGKLFETAYRLNIKMTDTLRFGAAWSKNYLYLVFEDETAPAVSDLVINGKKVNITSSNSKTGAISREVRIALSSVGIVGYDKTYPISFRVGDIYWSGTLVQDSNDYETMSHSSLYYGTTGSGNKKTIFLNTLIPDANGGNRHRSLAIVTGSRLSSAAGKITILDMDIAINHMPDNCTVAKTPSRNFITGGVTFSFRDDLSPVIGDANATEAFCFGIGKQNGKLKLYYWYNDANGMAQLGTADLPAVNSYHFRVEYGNGNGKVTSAKYFVNGILLADTASARVTASSFGTQQDNFMQIFAQAAAETEAVRVDLQVSNVSASHPQLLIIDDKSAAANMDMVIDAIGEVTLDSAEKINDARALYDSLTAAQKKLVTKYAALQAAEAKLRALRDQVNAQFTKYAFAEYTTEKMTVDGELKEVIWRTPLTIFGSGNLGLAWDFNYLYLTVTGSKVNTFNNLKINGVAVTDLGVTNGSIKEMKILLSSVGIKSIDFERGYDLSFTLDGKTWEGLLVFDTGKYARLKPSSVFYGATKSVATSVLNTANSTSSNRVGAIYDTTKLESINGMTTILEFDLKINSMPNNNITPTVGRLFANGGVGLTIRDGDVSLGENGMGTEAFMVGLVRQKGNMYLIYWEDSTEEFLYAPVEDYGTNNYHLRIEYEYFTNDDVSAKYYVNGLLVAESHDAKEIAETGAFGTGSSNRIQILAYGTDEVAVDATISDLSVSQNRFMDNPDSVDAITQEAIFGMLDLNHVQKDLNLPKEFVTINGERFELTWKTSDSAVVTKEGKVTRPLEDPTSATLTLVVDGEELWAVTVKVDPMSLEETESPANVDAAFSKAPIVIDGILDDEGWRMSGRVLDRNKQLYAEYGFQWTQSHLYVAVEYLNGINTLSLKLNGRYFTLKDGKLYRGGENVGGSGALAVTNGDVVELRIPLSVLGLPSKITSYGYAIPMSLKAGPYVGNGKLLRLSNIDWFVTVNRNHETVGATVKSVDAYHGVQRLANGYRMFDLYGGTNKAQVRSYVSFMSTDEYVENLADRIYDIRIEFDFMAEAMPCLPTDGSAFTQRGGAFGNSGFTCATGEITGADGTSLSYNYGIINTIHGLMFVMNVGGDKQTQLLNKQLGEKFSIAVEWTKEDTLKLFIDGELVNTFACVGYSSKSAANASMVMNMRSLFAPQSVADNYDVYVTNIAFGKVHNETGILDQLNFDDICGKNKTESKITSNLVLPTVITNGQLDKEYKITWNSNNPAVDATTGKVTRPQIGVEVVTLTATLSNGETKSFNLTVYGSKAQNGGVLHVLNDTNPANNGGVSSKDLVFTFDATNNSIIKILDGKATINYVVLKDGDDRARLNPETMTLWVSDDNQVYNRVKDYKLLQVGEKWYLYDFEATCKYVKVHYTQPDEDDSSFIGTYGEMIDAGYETVFGGGSATFAQTQYVLTNNTGKTQKDYAWTISKNDLGITGTDASIRVYADGKLLYHYVSGSNVVVRINDLAAGASVTLTVLSSTSKDVMDISNKEGVHEVVYGVRNSVLTKTRWYYLTLPAGTTFPDGSKLEAETIFAMSRGKYQISTDGGVTWTGGTVYNNAPASKTPVITMGEGGWIFDYVTGRMMFETYVAYESINTSNMDESHMHTDIIASDDGGKTWYVQYTMPCRNCMDEYIGNINIPTYALSYNAGIQLSSYDGKGPNVDFVFPLGYQYDNIGSLASRVCYTTDGGDTWHYSKNPVTYPSTFGVEGGCSEAWILERSDGVLVYHVRCQDESTNHFKVSYSYDKGITWTNDNIFTNYYAVNGQPFIEHMDIHGESTVIAAWGGNTSLGNHTGHRNPFVFASSANDGETFRNIQNILFKSFEERYDNINIQNTTNVSLVKYGGDNLLYTYRRNMYSDWIITDVEDFDDWFTRTKGGYDNFEHGTIQYEGWQRAYGTNTLASEIAQGKYSMRLGVDSKVLRSVPYLQDGKVSLDIYVSAGGSFTLELQSGHTRYYNSISVPIALRAEGGKIYFGDSNVASAEGIKEGWNTLVFDLNMTKDKATLSVNGGAAVNIPLKRDFDDYVNFIAIGTDKVSTIYVDEVLITSDLEPDVAVDAADKKAAAEVVELIKAIKTASNRDAAIKKARAAFDKLTQAQQDLIDARVLANNGKSGLAGMINYYEELRLAEDGDLVVEQLIDEIGVVNQYSGEKLKTAEDAYKKLTSAQKKQVSNYDTLRVARLKYNRIIAHKTVSDQEAAEAVQEMIDSLVLSNPLRYEKKITATRKAYNALSVEQMALVNYGHLVKVEQKLLAAQEEETRRILASMQGLIDSLDHVTIEQIILIEGLRANISRLTAEEKAVLNDQKLVLAEKALRSLKAGVEKKTLDEIRINSIMAYIDSIGQVTIEKKALIDAIRASYDKLTPKQQERIENYGALVIAEATVLAQIQLTDAVPNTGDTTPGGITYEAAVFVMPVMLLSALAMAALVIFPEKRKRRR